MGWTKIRIKERPKYRSSLIIFGVFFISLSVFSTIFWASGLERWYLSLNIGIASMVLFHLIIWHSFYFIMNLEKALSLKTIRTVSIIIGILSFLLGFSAEFFWMYDNIIL